MRPQALSLTAVIWLAVLTGVVVAASLPVKYYGGLVIVLTLVILFVSRPLYFLVMLFFVRALLDNYLVSIRFVIGGMDVGIGGIFSAFMIAGTCFYAVSRPDRLARLRERPVVLFGLFCLFSLFWAAISQDKSGAAKDLISRYSAFSILAMTVMCVQEERHAVWLVRTIVVSALAPVVIGFAMWGDRYVGRLAGTFAHPNVMAFYLLIIIGAVVCQVHRIQKSVSALWIDGVYLASMLAGLIGTMTRSAWAAFLCMTGIYALMVKRRWIIPLVLIGSVFLMLPVVQERLEDLFTVRGQALAVREESSLAWRFNTWKHLWRAAVRRPWTGHGINASAYAAGSFGVEAHNDYLRLFLESGVLGVVLYFGAYLAVFWHAFRRYRDFAPGSTIRRSAAFLLAFIPAFLLMSVSENLARYTAVHFYLMGMIGVYLGLYRSMGENPNGR